MSRSFEYSINSEFEAIRLNPNRVSPSSLADNLSDFEFDQIAGETVDTLETNNRKYPPNALFQNCAGRKIVVILHGWRNSCHPD